MKKHLLASGIPALTIAAGTQAASWNLENPQPDSHMSGIGVISGWHCNANMIELKIDDGPLVQAPYGSIRNDTLPICGDVKNGFGILWNYNKLGDGEHTVNAYADGVLFGTSKFLVATLGEEYVASVEASVVVADFPSAGQNTTLRWSESLQNFTISGSDGGGALSDEGALSGITAAHNATRAAVGVGPMTWNGQLAALAAGFIEDCEFAHSSSNERSNVAGFRYVGENLYMSWGFKPSGADVSNSWASEQADYNYAGNSCSGMCGHYTQQVWATSTNLGCAMKSCDDGYIVACEYGPGGNYIGQRPY